MHCTMSARVYADTLRYALSGAQPRDQLTSWYQFKWRKIKEISASLHESINRSWCHRGNVKIWVGIKWSQKRHEPATGEGFRRTTHRVFHCEEVWKEVNHKGDSCIWPRGMGAHLKWKMRRKYVELTFFPSLNLTCPSATTVSVIFCHGFEQLRVRVCVRAYRGSLFKIAFGVRAPAGRLHPASCAIRPPRQWETRPPPSSPSAKLVQLFLCIKYCLQWSSFD